VGPAARFCQECGGALASAAGPVVATDRSSSAAPGSYTPRHLAEKILAARVALEGERKQITVLFADLVGSTELIQGLDTEQAQRLLDGAVQRMMDAVHRYEGTVSHLQGDGLMALFGAPIGHEDHAVRACYAAPAMQDAVRRYADHTRMAHGVAVECRVGLHSGEVVVRLISDDLHMDYTAMGSTVHLASRMEQLARAGTSLLTLTTVGLTQGLVTARSLGPALVKGVAEPVETFELLGAAPVRRRFQAATARGLTRFVGRDVEVAMLQRAADRARAGHGQLVALVGEPGIGKSRLIHELGHASATDAWLVLESGAVSYGRTTAWLPVIDLLKAYCRIEARDDPAIVHEKLVNTLLGLDDALRPTLPAVLTLLDVPVDPSDSVEATAWQALDPPQRRRQTLDAVKRVLLRESQQQPLLLVVEDLHWIDGETQALLDSFVESLPGARVLLLVNYWPEYEHSWANKSYYTQLQLERLPLESAEALLHTLIGDQPGLRQLGRLLLSRTEGNPFFLEESVRALVESGALVGEPGAYRLARDLPSIEVPATVQAILAARIDRLPPEEKRLLQTASVVGKDVPYALLRAIADPPSTSVHASAGPVDADEQTRTGLAHLQAAEFLYETSIVPELEYTFTHALTHEVAYGSLLQDRRRAFHARIVAASEALYPDRLDEHVERLAHHALRGELWKQAVAYCRQAGARAMARSAYTEATPFFEQALEALGHLPEHPDRLLLAIDLRFDLRTASFELGEHRRAHDLARHAGVLAETAGDQGRLGRALTYQAHHERVTAAHRRAVEIGERAIVIGGELGDLGLMVAAADVAGASSFEMGLYQRAINRFSSSLALLAADLPQELLGQHIAPAVHSRAMLAYSLAWQGDFREAIQRVEEGFEIAETMQHPHTLLMSYEGLGLVSALKGDVARSITALEQARAIQDRWGFGGGAPAFIGYAYTLAGRIDEAVPSLELSLESAAREGFLPCTSLWTGWLAEANLRAGRLAEAREMAIRAVDLARAHQERGFEGEALYRLGEVVLQIEPFDPARAEGHFRDALAIAEELGMRPLQAHCHLGLGKLHRKMGRLPEARPALDVAVDLYLSMEMAHWVPEAEAVLADIMQASSAGRAG
jgi:class 3 adenylate cyclase/tetratricopeptide (TPR) repeat protein